MGSYWDANGKLVDGRFEALIRSSGGAEPTISNGVLFDGDTPGNSIFVTSHSKLFNESSWDRQRGNTQGTLLASAARTVSIQSPTQTNYNAKGVLVMLNITAASGTGGLVITIVGQDPISGAGVNLNVNPSAILATGLYGFILYPGATSTNIGANVKQVISAALPRNWYAYSLAIDATSYTYSLSYALIL